MWPIEIKAGQTIAADFFSSLTRWSALSGTQDGRAWLIYGGDQDVRHGQVDVIPWQRLPEWIEGA